MAKAPSTPRCLTTLARLAAILSLGATTVTGVAGVAGTASAAEAARIAIGEVSVTRRAPLDVAAVRTTAEGELRRIDTSRMPASRRFVVSLAVASADDAACTVNATLRDSRTGSMIAVLEGRARTTGTPNREDRAEIVRVAVRSAVRQIPAALPKR